MAAQTEVRQSAADQRLQAMSHPKRRRVLMHYRDKGPKAPIEVAAELRMSISDVSYHTRKLRDLGRIELVREEPIRGSTKHYYVAVEEHLVNTGEWDQIEPELREGLLIDFMQPLVDDFTRALKGGRLGSDERWHITRTPLKAVDQDGLEELLEAHERLRKEASEIARRSVERMAETGEKAIQVSTGQMCFEVERF